MHRNVTDHVLDLRIRVVKLRVISKECLSTYESRQRIFSYGTSKSWVLYLHESDQNRLVTDILEDTVVGKQQRCE